MRCFIAMDDESHSSCFVGGRKKVMFKGTFVCVNVREKTATNEGSGQMDGSSPRPQNSSR